MSRGAPIAQTWWLLVELDLPGLTGNRLRAIGPLSWTDVRALGNRWERAFGAGTTTCTERPGPVPKRVRVGPEPVVAPVATTRPEPAAIPRYHTGVVTAAVPAPVKAQPPARTAAPIASRVETPRAKATPAPRPASVPAARRRASGPSRLTDRARAAMARTRAARAAIDASIAGMEIPHV